jgi:hypothetical protein
MSGPEKKTELTRLTRELEAFVGTYCGASTAPPNDFVDEKCNDAYLMLKEALENLKQD